MADILEDRRKHLRLNAKDVGQPTCCITLEPGRTIVLGLTDISPGGFGATIPDYLVRHFHKAREFSHCQINIPGLEDVAVRVVDLWHLRSHHGETTTRAGFAFTSTIDWTHTLLDTGKP